MAKKTFQDIVPPERRSIRNIPIPPHRKKPVAASAPTPTPPPRRSSARVVEEAPDDHIPFTTNPVAGVPEAPSFDASANRYKAARRKKTYIKYSLLAVGVVLASFVVMTLGANAEVFITPKRDAISTNQQFRAERSGAAGALPFEVVSVSGEANVSVTATGEEMVERKSHGTIVIYNNHSSEDQRLIRNTRFETPEGLIYRIDESVVVPGRKTVDGEVVPGSIEAVVYADEPGEKYNIGLKDFTIPGFEGDPRYTTMYARSKTAMAEGFMGTVRVVAPSELESARSTMQGQIFSNLESQILGQVPEGYFLVRDSIFMGYESLPQTEARGNTVRLNERGTMHAVAVSKQALAAFLAGNLNSSISNINLTIENEGEFELIVEDQDFNPASDQSFGFSVSGNPVLVGNVNQEAVREALLGVGKGAITVAIAPIAEIDSARVLVSPMWKKSIPDNPKRIDIVIEPR